ncbi:MAG: penicillin acylase family protein [Streptosporangiaceae bacterium]
MLPDRRRSRLVRRIVNLVLALAVSTALLVLLGAGYHVIPALGPALDPGRGAWASAADATLPRSQALRLPGLAEPARVSFTSQGLASISAASDPDLYLALGYVHARFRLTQMDLERRLGEGRLAQLAGPGAVSSDQFELRLGLLRTARQEWAAMPKSSPVARDLVAYARGVNDYLAQLRASHQWPAVFSLAGVYPASWTPVDSLVVQGDFTQGLSFTTTPLDYALLERSLGARNTMAWFPVLSPGEQHPYDPGPYRHRGLAPLAGSASTALASAGLASAGLASTRLAAAGRPAAAGSGRGTAGRATARQQAGGGPGDRLVTDPQSTRAAAAILAAVRSLAPGQVHEYPDSNAWAVNGSRAAGGGALLAGDPHVPQTLPSFWFQVALTAPGLAVSGVSTPGMPGVLLGHNASIAWSLTDTQNQSTLFYDEKTSKSRPGEYFWRGQWRRMQRVRYTIPVRGGATRHLTVDITVHGPVMTTAGQTVAVDWMGNVPSPDLAAFLDIDKARDFAQFTAALAGWRAPTENFVYADRRGHIGAIAPGYYPVVRHGDPWLPLPGTGADDVAGVIPFAAVPRVYDPRDHMIVSANQRPAGNSYPYYIGTSANAFDPGYRAATELTYLHQHAAAGPPQLAALQVSLTDGLARQMVPSLLAALKRDHGLTPAQQQAAALLKNWNDEMTTPSAAASVWFTFWADYLSAVFQPWWTAKHVPVHLDRDGLAINPYQASLDEVLASWTRGDQRNPAFTPPGGPRRDATTVMRKAFATAVSGLARQLGGAPSSWSWGRLHSRRFPSLTGATGLGYGPEPSGGDPWTPDGAYGGMQSTAGPSWRMIAAWTRGGTAEGEGIYPGGQSENPASAWYENLIPDWWAGRYLPMPVAGPAGPAVVAVPAAGSGETRWVLRP